MDGRTHIEEIQGAVIGKRHFTLVVVANTVTTNSQPRTQGETAPTVRPVDIAVDTRFSALEMVSAEYIDTIISDTAIIGIITIIVAVTQLIVDTQTIAKLPIFVVRTVVARIEIKSITILLTQKISVFIQVGVNVIETVVVIVGSILVEPAIQTDAEVMPLVVKLLGVVCSEMAEARL